MRLAEIRNGFFGFLARVFDSWASFLRPPAEQPPREKEDPFVAAPEGPPAHWLEMTAGLSFTEYGVEPVDDPLDDPGEPRTDETLTGLSEAEAFEIGEKESGAARPREISAGASAVEEALGKKTGAPVPENDRPKNDRNDAQREPEPKNRKTAHTPPAFIFRESRPEDAEAAADAPGSTVSQTSKKPGDPRSLAGGFLRFGKRENPEHFSRSSDEPKPDPPGKNAAKGPAGESRIVPGLSKELPDGTQGPPPPGISPRQPDNVFEALTPQRKMNVPDRAPAAVAAEVNLQPLPAAVFPGKSRAGDGRVTENFIGRAASAGADRFPETSAVVPVKVSASSALGDAARFAEPVNQNTRAESGQFALAFYVPAKPETASGRGFVERGETAKNFPPMPAIDGGSKWADLPELELGGAGNAHEADDLRRNRLAQLEREQKGERWSV